MRLSNIGRSLALMALLVSAAAVAKNDKQAAPAAVRVHHEFLTAPSRDAVPNQQKPVVPAQDIAPRREIAAFSRSENAVIRDYFVQYPAKWTALPPSLVKDYGRGKPLPLGVEKKELPWGLMKRLPRRQGCEYRQVGRDVVIIDTETLLVVDIMKDVFG